MFLLPLLEGFLAITVIMLMFSTIVSLIVEALNNKNFWQKRQMYLFDSIRSAFNDRNGIYWGNLIYNHPAIREMKSKTYRYPAYISATTFADALLTVVREYTINKAEDPIKMATEAKYDFEFYTDAFRNLPEGKFKTLISNFLLIAEKDKALDGLKMNIKTWFNNYQDRVIGDYKKSIRKDLRWVGITLALLCNINAIFIGVEVFSNRSLRQSLVGLADKAAKDSLFLKDEFSCRDCTIEQYENLYRGQLNTNMRKLDSLGNAFRTAGLPIGWELPKSQRELKIDFLRHDIAVYKRIRKDTLSKIRSRYCLYQALLPTASQSHELTVELLQKKAISVDTLIKISGQYKVELNQEEAANIVRFINLPADSTNFGKCLPTAEIKNKYESCLTQCKDLKNASFESAIITALNNRIKGDEREMELFNQLEPSDMWEAIGSFPDYVGETIGLNLQKPTDWMIYIIGAVTMGLLGSVGSTAWFEILMKLIQLRNTGVRPRKEE